MHNIVIYFLHILSQKLLLTLWIMHTLGHHSSHGIGCFMSFLRMKYKQCSRPWGELTTTSFDFPTGTGVGKSREVMDYLVKNSLQFNRLGETRNVSNRPVVFGDLVGDDWNTVCLGQLGVFCDPNNALGPLQRCPFTDDPNLCHSSNPDWPTMQEVNEVLVFDNYAVPPFNNVPAKSVRAHVDIATPLSIEECRKDIYCLCVPGGIQCENQPDNSSSLLIINGGIHFKVRKNCMYAIAEYNGLPL